MSIGLFVTIKIKPGSDAAFVSACNELQSAVKKNEPGAILYEFFKSRDEADTYHVMEIYKDQAALESHGKTQHMASIGPKMGASMAGRPTIKFIDSVSG
jgi:quinol monooxygenase YgiN